MNVTAVVVAGARRGRVDALAAVRGVPMVALAVRALLASGLVEHVTVVGEQRSALERACSHLPVRVRAYGPGATARVGAHTGKRETSTSSDGLVTARAGDVLLLHDAARPLAPSMLAAAVVEAVGSGHDMVVPVLPLTDTVKRVDDAGLVIDTPDRAGLRVLQTPLAARAEVLPPELPDDPLALVRRHTAAGGIVHTVPGHPAAFAVRTPWDLELAELLAEGASER